MVRAALLLWVKGKCYIALQPWQYCCKLSPNNIWQEKHERKHPNQCLNIDRLVWVRLFNPSYWSNNCKAILKTCDGWNIWSEWQALSTYQSLRNNAGEIFTRPILRMGRVYKLKWTLFVRHPGDLTFETLITILTIESLNSVNHSYLTINCDTGQHSQFLRCLNSLSLSFSHCYLK